MSSTWRLLDDGERDGVTNMSLDRAIQLAREAGEAPPTLRLYRWKRPTITLGRFQPVGDVDFEVCKEFGIDVVRRFTGGRGVLHADELTYSVVASVNDGIPRGVAASYRMLSEALARAYQLLGLGEASVTERDAAPSASGACYLVTTRADLSLGTAKLSGSAQVWHGCSVLQHGSFVLSRDVQREARAFRLDAEQTAALASHAATIESITGSRPSIDDVGRAVVAAFSEVMDVDIVPGTFSATEIEIAHGLEDQVRVSETESPQRRVQP